MTNQSYQLDPKTLRLVSTEKRFTIPIVIYLILYGLALLNLLISAGMWFTMETDKLAAQFKVNPLDMQINFVVYGLLATVAYVGIFMKKKWGLFCALTDLFVSILKDVFSLPAVASIGAIGIARSLIYCAVHVTFIVLFVQKRQLAIFKLESANKKILLLISGLTGIGIYAAVFLKSWIFH